jgi:glyceraldehyde 3-phosphate dehydrogenase (phosphorylating)
VAIKIGINGFGRIGRMVFRAAVQNFRDIEVVGINDLLEPEYLAYMLQYDSVHGRFKGEVSVDNGTLIVNGKRIRLSAVKDPSELKWGEVGADVVVESTGLFLTKETAQKHIDAGAKKVILSAPSKDDTPMFVYGVNDKTYAGQAIISNASCTTNCLAPMVKVIRENFGFKHGSMVTIHSYTNDQVILDYPHKDLRRARAAALSMIPTTTGAAKATALVIPEVKGKIDGISIRVPTPDVSLTELTVEVERGTTIAEVNAAFRAAAEGPLKGILQYTEIELVSSDYIGNPASCILDSKCTNVIDNTLVKVSGWYDNEWGYSCRCVDLLGYIGARL